MVHRYVQYNGHWLTIIWPEPYGQRDLLLRLALNQMVIYDRRAMHV
jgi:hypothetical protein